MDKSTFLDKRLKTCSRVMKKVIWWRPQIFFRCGVTPHLRREKTAIIPHFFRLIFGQSCVLGKKLTKVYFNRISELFR